MAELDGNLSSHPHHAEETHPDHTDFEDTPTSDTTPKDLQAESAPEIVEFLGDFMALSPQHKLLLALRLYPKAAGSPDYLTRLQLEKPNSEYQVLSIKIPSSQRAEIIRKLGAEHIVLPNSFKGRTADDLEDCYLLVNKGMDGDTQAGTLQRKVSKIADILEQHIEIEANPDDSKHAGSFERRRRDAAYQLIKISSSSINPWSIFHGQMNPFFTKKRPEEHLELQKMRSEIVRNKTDILSQEMIGVPNESQTEILTIGENLSTAFLDLIDQIIGPKYPDRVDVATCDDKIDVVRQLLDHGIQVLADNDIAESDGHRPHYFSYLNHIALPQIIKKLDRVKKDQTANPNISLKNFLTDIGPEGWIKAALSKTETIQIPSKKLEVLNNQIVSFMIVGDLFFDQLDPTSHPARTLVEELEGHLQEGGFHLTSYEGNLVLIANTENAEAKLIEIAHKIHHNDLKHNPVTNESYRSTRILVSKGTAQIIDGRLSINTFPSSVRIDHKFLGTHDDVEGTELLKSLAPGVYLTDHIVTPDGQIRGRHTTCSISVNPMEDLPWRELRTFSPEAQFTTNGPDKLIGCEDQRKRLIEAVEDKNKDLIIVRGPAAMGKTTLLRLTPEVQERLITTITFDASDKNNESSGLLEGSGLVTMTKHLGHLLAQHRIKLPVNLLLFNRLSRRQQLEKAQQDPDSLVEMCLEAATKLQAKTGKNHIAFDDIHHVDSHSIFFVKEFFRRFIHESKGKIIMLYRDEEMYKAEDIKKFEDEIGPNRKTDITVNELLNFTKFPVNQEAGHAYQFIYHMLPRYFSNFKLHREEVRLGDWYKVLGEKAGKWPIVLQDLTNRVLSDPNNLILGANNTLEIDPHLLQEITELTNGIDGTTKYLQNKIRRFTTEDSLQVLQGLALLGQHFHEWQILEFISFLGLTEKKESIFAELIRTRFLVPDQAGSAGSLTFQHPTIIDYLRESIQEGNTLAALSNKLYEYSQNDQTITTDNRIHLLINQASTQRLSEPAFCEEIDQLMDQFYTEKNEANNYPLTFKTLGKLLKNHLSPDPETQAGIVSGILKMPTHAQGFLIKNLLRYLDNSLMVGKTSSSAPAFQILEKLESETQNLVDPGLFHRLGFQMAYRDRNRNLMESEHEKVSATGELTEAMELLMRFKIEGFQASGEQKEILAEFLNKKNTLQQQSNQYKERTGQPDPAFTSLVALAEIVAPMNQLESTAIYKKGLRDEEVLHRPETLKLIPELATTLKKIGSGLTTYLNLATRLSPRETGIVMQHRAKTLALSGHFDKAISILGEAWRRCELTSIHDEALRSACTKGDLEIIKALEQNPDSSEYIQGLINGFRIYDTEVRISDTNLNDDRFLFSLVAKVRRIRAAGLVIQHYDATEVQDVSSRLTKDPNDFDAKSELFAIREKLNPYFLSVIDDLKWLKANKDKPLSDPEVIYLLGHVGSIVGVIRTLYIEHHESQPVNYELTESFESTQDQAVLSNDDINFIKNLRLDTQKGLNFVKDQVRIPTFETELRKSGLKLAS